MKYIAIILLSIVAFANLAVGQRIAAVKPHFDTSPTSITFSVLMPHSNFTRLKVICFPPLAVFSPITCQCEMLECDPPPSPQPTLFEKTLNYTLESGYISIFTNLYLSENRSDPNCVIRSSTLVDSQFTIIYSNLALPNQKKQETAPFPNPAKGFFFLPLPPLLTVASLSLTNLVGQTIPLQLPDLNGEVELPKQLLPGPYFLRIINKDGNLSNHKLIIL